MKKRLKWIIISVSSVILVLGFLVVLKYIIYRSKTIKVSDIRSYCVENTEVSASSYVRYGVSSEPQYAFWIAQDGTSDFQEMYIFKQEKFGFLSSNRYSFVYRVSGNEVVGSVMFMPRDEKNKKKTTNLLVFYSSNEYRITDYTITFYENGDLCTKKGQVSRDQAFIASISNLGISNGVEREFLKAEFYDDQGNLVLKRGQ